MPPSSPPPLSAEESQRRLRRVKRLAGKLGFVGQVEYRHIFSGTGGAQYRKGGAPDQDLLVVYAEAFDRDANPDDFSLEAILAHERGHQLLVRHRMFRRFPASGLSLASEETVASLIGSLIAQREVDRHLLWCKAMYEAIQNGMDIEHATRALHEFRLLLEKAL